MTFTLLIFHLIILLLILPRNDCAAVIHDGGWTLKYLLVLAVFTGMFWVPMGFFQVWAEISRYASILFMIIQCLYILIGAYGLGDYMVNQKTNDESWRNGVLLVYTVLLFLASVALIITSFIWFTGTGCGHNMAIIIATIVMFVLVFVLRCRKENSLLTAALANLWIVYIGWSAMASQPGECNQL